MASFDWRKLSRPITLVLIAGIAIAVLVHLWHYYNAEPWTRDGRVRGDVIQVSSDVSGLVTEVLVHDNQSVKQGQVLFKIDVARQALDVEQAKSDLAKAKASLAAAEAELFQSKNKIRCLPYEINRMPNMNKCKRRFSRPKPILRSNRR